MKHYQPLPWALKTWGFKHTLKVRSLPSSLLWAVGHVGRIVSIRDNNVLTGEEVGLGLSD